MFDRHTLARDRQALVARARSRYREVEDLRDELEATEAIVDSLLEELASMDRQESRLLDELAERPVDRTPPTMAPDIGIQLQMYRRRNR